jgi:valyl-tRNA synthetase
MTLRPNAHDIIRTWDFYSIVRSLYMRGQIPWTEVLISGHALDPAGKKLSKSKLTAAEDPTASIEKFSADAIRYWSTTVRTGGDTLLNDDTIRNGNRLVTKLWNAARLSLAHLEGYQPPEQPPVGLNTTDRWLLARLHETVRRATQSMEEYEFASAKAEVERFFWADLADNYLELVKRRLYNDDDESEGDSTATRSHAQYVLFHALKSVIQMFAPFLPHITEEIYLAGFSEVDRSGSVHVSRWPSPPDSWRSDAALLEGRALLDVTEEVRRWKGERQLGVGTPLEVVRVECEPELADALSGAVRDLRSVTRAARVEIASTAGVQGVRLTVSPLNGAA